MEDGPTRTDITVTNARTKDNELRILRKCRFGWEKITTFRGLRIHMGKKCDGGSHKQPCTAQAGQTSSIQGQVENHSAIGPDIVEAEQEERTDVNNPQVEHLEAPPSIPRVMSRQNGKRI